MHRLWLLTIALAASGAHAEITTPVNAQGGGDGGERCLAGYRCVDGIYDGALSLISIFEMDLGFAPGDFTRVDDALDTLWSNSLTHGGQVQALARYADDRLRLGVDGGDGYLNLTGVVSDGKVRVNHAPWWFGDTHAWDLVKVADSWIDIPLDAGEPFTFVLDNLTLGYRVGSDQAAPDMMVTWRVPDTVPHYFIAWEDRFNGDFDYNDLVIEVRFASPAPEPQSYALLLAGLAFLGFAARRRMRR